jgi:DNA mismatch repair ATPase MutS
LQGLRARLSAHAVSGSAALSRLATIVNLAGSRRNQLMGLLVVPLMFPLAVALLGERWRSRHGHVVRTWIEVVGELEALLSLAGYRYEHPADPLPELREGPACFEGRQLGHPLLPVQRCVRNDVSLADPARLLLVSGSNMSGKSTLLRTVGINTVLAMAGAPVRAARLALTPLQVGASIRVNDSLHEGSSRFYAEITRLRQLLTCADGPIPLLYLLDELLMGTNSKDRQIGANGILKAFVARGALGITSTHDLALTHIDGLSAGVLHNVHFQDELLRGRMSFDFKLREGVVEKSNGLELMRSVGLEV